MTENQKNSPKSKNPKLLGGNSKLLGGDSKLLGG